MKRWCQRRSKVKLIIVSSTAVRLFSANSRGFSLHLRFFASQARPRDLREKSSRAETRCDAAAPSGRREDPPATNAEPCCFTWVSFVAFSSSYESERSSEPHDWLDLRRRRVSDIAACGTVGYYALRFLVSAPENGQEIRRKKLFRLFAKHLADASSRSLVVHSRHEKPNGRGDQRERRVSPLNCSRRDTWRRELSGNSSTNEVCSLWISPFPTP